MSVTTEVTPKAGSVVIREDTLYQSIYHKDLIWLSFMQGPKMGMLCVASPGHPLAAVGTHRQAEHMYDIVHPFYGSVTINSD